MNAILQLNINRLKPDEFSSFITEFIKIVDKYDSSTLRVEVLFSPLKQHLSLFKQCLLDEENSTITDDLHLTDTNRDNIWQAIRLIIEGHKLSPFEKHSKSAEVLHKCLELYGDPQSIHHKAQTATISNLSKDFLSQGNLPLLENIGIPALAQELNKENNNFKTLETLQKEVHGNSQTNSLEQRKSISQLYKQIIKNTEALLMVGLANPETTDFIAELNTCIEQYQKHQYIKHEAYSTI